MQFQREHGHQDTRYKNFECEKNKTNLGCDNALGCNLGVDVAG
jgi:hypothetical protein